ncbi:hypothetical protein Cgig2_001067 [Carnegiea gigantea]|uniref:Uncharacterized protein n=1 Tax=Carnegiea gigantea TaxID=171969 RepID=A0A9Q1K2S8_9CARY|nr:hypothetical protein Cgig2_001067 [Carnegiea gigantea]
MDNTRCCNSSFKACNLARIEKPQSSKRLMTQRRKPEEALAQPSENTVGETPPFAKTTSHRKGRSTANHTTPSTASTTPSPTETPQRSLERESAEGGDGGLAEGLNAFKEEEEKQTYKVPAKGVIWEAAPKFGFQTDSLVLIVLKASLVEIRGLFKPSRARVCQVEARLVGLRFSSSLARGLLSLTKSSSSSTRLSSFVPLGVTRLV